MATIETAPTTDTQKPAPTVVVRIPRPPEMPTLRRVETGDDLEKLLTETAGEGYVDEQISEMDAAFGVIRSVKSKDGNAYVKVHTRADAWEGLQGALRRYKAELELAEMLRAVGVLGPAPEGCTCGMCGELIEDDREVDPTKAN